MFVIFDWLISGKSMDHELTQTQDKYICSYKWRHCRHDMGLLNCLGWLHVGLH